MLNSSHHPKNRRGNGPADRKCIMAKLTQTRRDELVSYLMPYFENDARPTAYTVLTNVSRSGMSRRIKVIVLDKDKLDGQPHARNVSHLVAELLGFRYNRDEQSVVVSGCGMDMGFHLIYSLSCALFASDSATDAGYVIEQRWL